MVALPIVLPTCGQIADRLSEWIDGELEADGASRVELHLAICTGCARLAAELAATVEALHRHGRRGKTQSLLH